MELDCNEEGRCIDVISDSAHDIEFKLLSSSLCADVSIELPISAKIESFQDVNYNIPQQEFLTGTTIYFVATIYTYDLPIKQAEIVSIEYVVQNREGKFFFVCVSENDLVNL